MGGHTLEVEVAVCALQKHSSNWYFVLEANFKTTNHSEGREVESMKSP